MHWGVSCESTAVLELCLYFHRIIVVQIKECLFYQEHQERWLELSPGEGRYLWAQWEAYSPHSVS